MAKRSLMRRFALACLALAAAACATAPADAGRKGAGLGFRHTTQTFTPVLPGAIAYDVRFGTDATGAAATGWFTFAHKAGTRDVFVNSSQADDTGNGLTAATAKKTLPAAITVFRTGFTAGDHLMLAGTGGRTYSDDGLSGGWSGLAGFSATYPTVIQSYDPATPADATKYGRLLGSNRPIYVLSATGPPFLSNNANNGDGNFAIQGIIIDAQNADSATFGTTFSHNNLAFQNDLFKQVALQFSAPTGSNAGINISKSGFYGQWRASDGNTNGVFADAIDPTSYVQDNVFAHAGWKIGASRSDQTLYGGPSVFGHAVYHPAHNTGGHYDRNVYIDSASDGWGLRGYATATQLVSIDEPIVGAFSGFSGGASEAPNGVVITLDDFAVLGGDNLTTDPIGGGRGEGPGINNIIAPSYMRNGVLLDNPQMNNGNSWVIGITYKFAGQFTPQTLIMDKIRAWNYSYRAQSTGYAGIYAVGTINVTWSNALLDSLFSDQTGPGATGSISGTGVRTWTVGDYPSPKTKAQVITALGFADKASMVNAMLDFPHLPWAQAIIGITFPGVGATPYYATAPPPSLAGLPTPTVVYSSDATAPTLSALTVSGVGSTTATLNSTTNDGSGWLYEIVSTSGTPPNQYQLGNSQDSTGSAPASAGRQAVSASGAQTYSITGLTSGATYFAYEVQQDPAGNRSSILSSSSFTTTSSTTWAAATDWTLTNSNLTGTRTAGTISDALIRASSSKVSGTIDFRVDNLGSSGFYVLGFDTGVETAWPGHDGTGASFGYFSNGNIWFGGVSQATVASYAATDVIRFIKSGGTITVQKQTGGSGAFTTVWTDDVTRPFYGLPSAPVAGSAKPTGYNSSVAATGAQITLNPAAW